MNGIKVTGGIPLQGEVQIQGSKNAALPIMAAALLNKGTTVLLGCPKNIRCVPYGNYIEPYGGKDLLGRKYPGNSCRRNEKCHSRCRCRQSNALLCSAFRKSFGTVSEQ